MQTKGTETTWIEKEVLITTIDTNSNFKDDIKIQHVCCQTDIHVDEDYDDLQEGGESTPTFDEFLRHQATDLFRHHAAEQVENKSAEFKRWQEWTRRLKPIDRWWNPGTSSNGTSEETPQSL